MPVKIGAAGKWQVIEPTTDWKTMPAPGQATGIEVATDLFFINVLKD
jgi:hypothetical protein